MSRKLIFSTVGLIAGLVLVGFIGIQFVPVDRSNPPVTGEPRWDSPQTRALMERACFDCHSNATQWPWYSRIAPVSWMVADHVHDGRSHLNFSEWDAAEVQALLVNGDEDDDEEEEYEHNEGGEHGEDAEEMVEVIQSEEMPLPSYLLAHPEARLTEAETQQLIDGIRATFGGGQAAARMLPNGHALR